MNTENNNSSILIPILKKIPLFKDINDDLHHEIIQHIVLMYYPSGYTLFKQGAQGDALYIVKSGAIEIYKEPKEEGDLPEKLATIGEGGFFGEMSLVSEEPRNASAKAIAESEIFILNKTDFKTLLDTNPSLAEQVSATVIARLKENDKSQQ